MVDKIDWFKQEKKSFFKGIPKKDSSGKGIRLNKGRGGCPIEKQKKYSYRMSYEFTPERALKTAVAFPLVAGGILIGTKLISEIGDL